MCDKSIFSKATFFRTDRYAEEQTVIPARLMICATEELVAQIERKSSDETVDNFGFIPNPLVPSHKGSGIVKKLVSPAGFEPALPA
jgi:hypothetical protein